MHIPATAIRWNGADIIYITLRLVHFVRITPAVSTDAKTYFYKIIFFSNYLRSPADRANADHAGGRCWAGRGGVEIPSQDPEFLGSRCFNYSD